MGAALRKKTMTSFSVEAEEALAWHSRGLLCTPPQAYCRPTACEEPTQGSLLWLSDRDMEAALPYALSFHSLGCLTAELLNLLSLLTLSCTLISQPKMVGWDASLPWVQSILRSPSMYRFCSAGHCSLFFDRQHCRPRARAREHRQMCLDPRQNNRCVPLTPLYSHEQLPQPLCRSRGHCLSP